MNSDSIRYLQEHTDITFTTEGSISRALLEANNLEVSRMQEFIVATAGNTFIDTATGFYLDLIGEMLGVRRLPKISSSTSIDDQVVLFSVATGRLGDHLANPTNANQGLITAGTKVQTADSTIVYEVSEDVTFNKNLKEVYVPVLAESSGEFYNVGKGRLTSHSGPIAISVTNVKAITNGSDEETDKQYRFRLSNNLSASPTANEVAVRLAALGNPDVANVQLRKFARGAGTFDVLLVPVGNQVSSRSLEITQQAIDRVSAFGINSRVIQPTYIKFRLTVQLLANRGTRSGSVDSNILRVKSAILDYFETIPIGGELVINRLRAAVVSAISEDIRDIKILELCLNGRAHIIRNFKLKPDELFTPDVNSDTEAVQVV